MNRLLQGDVGCGKNIVALFVILIAIDNTCQGCLMAPTEILAQQHYKTIKNYLKNFNIKIELLTGSVKASLSSIVVPDIAFGCTVISSPIFCATRSVG